MDDQDVMTRIAGTILIEVINASSIAKPIYRQFGISDTDFEHLARMNSRELRHVAASNVFTVATNARVLNMSVQRTLKSRDIEHIIQDAIRLGASRKIMHEYADIHAIKFKDILSTLDEWESSDVGRPQIISNSDYAKLADLHNAIGLNAPIHSNIDHLRCLIMLSQQSGISINRIHEYYYKDNKYLYTHLSGHKENSDEHT